MARNIIDAHCHTFNGDDLPLDGFFKDIILSDHPDLDTALIRRLGDFLTRLVNFFAPGYTLESSELMQMIDRKKSEGVSALTLMSTAGIAGRPTDVSTPSKQDFTKAIEKLINKISEDKSSENTRFVEFLKQQMGFKEDDQLDGVKIKSMSNKMMSGLPDNVVNGAMKLVFHLTKYRYENTQIHFNTYLKNADNSYYSSPLIVDYDKWVEGRPKVSLEKQIELMVLNNQLHEGRLLPFIPFDPCRQINGPSPSMDLIHEAIAGKGFVGVKVYPPMGYKPIGNADDDYSEFSRCGAGLPEDFGRQLDDAFQELFKYCKDNWVPITTHCNRSYGPDMQNEMKADPRYWKIVANQHKTLKINLGHFGGSANWSRTIVDAINEDNQIYADLSYASEILKKEHRDYFIARMKEYIEDNPVLKDRLMFGTDWMLLCMENDHEDYVKVFEEVYAEIVDTEEDMHKFFYQNAVDFFGLQTEVVRKRLEDFYSGYGINSPLKLDFPQ
jgi:predicted TIM-barrel fold metal-dependent hydrolase